MRNDDPDQRRSKSDDQQWDDFVKAVAAEQEAANRPAGAPPSRRVWPRNAALAVGAAAVVAIGLQLVPSAEDSAAPAAPAAPTMAVPAVATTATTGAAGPTAAAGRPQIPLDQVFPAEVRSPSGAVFTRVASATLPSCTEPDSVGSRLIAMIKAGQGCVGEQVALYKDARNDQFNLAVFTMRDKLDALHTVTRLSEDFEDFEVGAQAPPPASGLPTLPPDSGMVQAFSGSGRAMLVSLGQWSDGRSTDRQQLVDLEGPLRDAVGKALLGYEAQS
ncbi:hypothetical protein [Streptomyces sp. CBMA123]|uniref:hypothetical protein n=1 Tax=Streptomyces sp. CBMA123 TaxID=1896313 RepID=UPI0016619830|nr:hypothetical protein [Streptomyces sp. CBMA123]MBD0691771.1 hypothetical protein [Streptomyces sp. CBMA123]